MFSSFFGNKAEGEAEAPSEGEKPSFFAGILTNLSDVGQRIKAGVEKVADSTIGDFTREQQKFSASKRREETFAQLPWTGFSDEEALKTQIINLSTDKRNFLRDPPGGSKPFVFDYNNFASAAKALLDIDERLNAMRFELVPKNVSEEHFWRNFFYRVLLIRQAAEVAEGSEKAAAIPPYPRPSVAPPPVVDMPNTVKTASAVVASAAALHETPPAEPPAPAEGSVGSGEKDASLDAAGGDADETVSNGSFTVDHDEEAAATTADLSQLGLADAPHEDSKHDDFEMLDEELKADLEGITAEDKSAINEDELDDLLKDS